MLRGGNLVWQIVNGKTFSCFRIVCRVALTQSKAHPDQPALVIYKGPRKKAWPNNDPQTLDFYLHADGRKDFSVDPNWGGHSR